MERRLAAILATDVAGYTQLTELNDEASAATLRTYRTVVEEVIGTHRGRVFSLAGDSIFAEFPSVVEAIRCAVEIQHEIADRNSAQEGTRMQFRIGVNLGDIIAEDDGLFGTGVNVAARLEQLAEPGGICVSQTVYDQVRKIVEMSFEDMGEVRLKNIADPVHVYRIESAPMSWLRRTLLRRRGRSRLRMVAVGSLLLVAAVMVASYLAVPSDLRRGILGGGRVAQDQASLAILPFDDLSPDDEQQYLADGITEELVTGLAKFPDILVVGGWVPGDPGAPRNLKQIGEDLGVRYVVEGTLQQSDRSIRVTAQLIEAASGRHIWAERYDRDLSNIFEIRDEIMRSVIATVTGTRGRLAAAETERLAAKDPSTYSAYDNVRRGWYEWSKYTMENNLAARRLFERASEIDPSYAAAYAGLAWTYSSEYDFGWTDDYDETLRLTLDNARKAVDLDANDYNSHWILGWASLYNQQYDQALASYRKARALNPNDAELLAEMGNMLIYVGMPEQAVEQVTEAIRLNPYHEEWYPMYLGWALEEAGRPEEAVATLEQAIPSDPTKDDLWILPTLAAAYADPEVDRPEDAQRIVKQILTLDPEFSLAELVALSPYKVPEQASRAAKAMRRAGLPD